MEIRVVTLGLDGAGKTTILFKLKQDEFMQPIPTIGKYAYCFYLNEYFLQKCVISIFIKIQQERLL